MRITARMTFVCVFLRASGGSPEGIYRSSLDARTPQNPTKGEEHQGSPEGGGSHRLTDARIALRASSERPCSLRKLASPCMGSTEAGSVRIASVSSASHSASTCDVDVVKGCDVDVKGYAVDVKGCEVDVKGYAVDVKGYDHLRGGRRVEQELRQRAERLREGGLEGRVSQDLHLEDLHARPHARERGGAVQQLPEVHVPARMVDDVSSWYGCSCGNDGKGALNTPPETLLVFSPPCPVPHFRAVLYDNWALLTNG
eukprot:2187770-Pyramimonas_sp.AAC.2